MMCDKLPFDTEDDARKAMVQVPEKPSGQIPIRVYRCPNCRKWHYTSKTQMRRRV